MCIYVSACSQRSRLWDSKLFYLHRIPTESIFLLNDLHNFSCTHNIEFKGQKNNLINKNLKYTPLIKALSIVYRVMVLYDLKKKLFYKSGKSVLSLHDLSTESAYKYSCLTFLEYHYHYIYTYQGKG